MKGDTHTHTRTGFACGILGSQERERDPYRLYSPLFVSQSAIKSNRFLFDFPFVFGWPKTTHDDGGGQVVKGDLLKKV
jgi:hypothetical protein